MIAVVCSERYARGHKAALVPIGLNTLLWLCAGSASAAGQTLSAEPGVWKERRDSGKGGGRLAGRVVTPPCGILASMNHSVAALNEGCEYRERLGPSAEGKTLLAYLSARYSHSSAQEWQARIQAAQVLLDGQPACITRVLRRGQEVVWRRPPWQEPDALASFEVLYEDADLLAVCKPPGLPTLPGANFLRNTLLHQVQREVPDAMPLHRLGRWTSGLVLCGRTHLARAELTRAWSTPAVTKRYRALASGTPAAREFAIDTPIGLRPHPLLGAVHAASPTGKASLSDVSVLEVRENAFLGDVRIATGRPHQIRIHLAAAGHPLVGDPLYLSGGTPAPDSRALPGDPGYHLHAAELVFPHPRTGQKTVIECVAPTILRHGVRA